MAWPPKEMKQKPRAIELPRTLIDQIDALLGSYPEASAALIPALHACQRHFGSISEGVELALARRLALSPSHVADTLSFYTMLRAEPVGKYHIEVCQTLTCAITGADFLADYLTEKLGVGFGDVTSDGKFSLGKIECIGACEQAPAILVNNELYGNLSAKKIDALLGGLK